MADPLSIVSGTAPGAPSAAARAGGKYPATSSPTVEPPVRDPPRVKRSITSSP